MLPLATALLLCVAPPAQPDDVGGRDDAALEPAPDSNQDQVDAPSEAGEPALTAPTVVILAPRRAGQYALVDGRGQVVGEPLVLSAERPHAVQLAAGVYYLHDSDGRIQPLVIAGEGPLVWDGETVLPEAAHRARAQAQAEAQAAEQAEALRQAQLARTTPPPPARPRKNRRAWASPLASTIVPGTGQIINGQGGKGTGILFATIGSVVGAAALYNLANDGTRPLGAEYARLISYGVLSTAAPMLWIYGIADAYRIAADKPLRPARDHHLRLSLSRSMTVGFRADVHRPGFYDDWSVAIMGQPIPRLSVGVSDLSVKISGGEPPIWQFGVRGDYRVFDRNRLWIDLGVGVAMQAGAGPTSSPLDPDAASVQGRTRFGAVPYGQLDLRLFVLDHLSLDLTPRLSVPVTTRYFSAHRALPRYAPTLELGAGVATYF